MNLFTTIMNEACSNGWSTQVVEETGETARGAFIKPGVPLIIGFPKRTDDKEKPWSIHVKTNIFDNHPILKESGIPALKSKTLIDAVNFVVYGMEGDFDRMVQQFKDLAKKA